MKSEQHDVKKAAQAVGERLDKENAKDLDKIAAKAMKRGIPPKDLMGLSDQTVEGIYAQAYRLYNTGKYKDSSQLFRLLIMLNPSEAKYALGLAACFHMLKEYKSAIEMYTVCGMVDPNNPVPHYHSSDCFVQMGDKISSMIALEMAIKRAGDRPEFQQLKDRSLLTLKSLKQELAKPKQI